MPIPAQSIIKTAHETLHDEDGIRWPAFELVRYLNIGQRVIVTLRPDQKCTTAPVSLTPGHQQQLPPTAMALMDIPNNATGRKRRITKVDVLHLDAVSPDWRSRPASVEIAHFMHDIREPRTFDVYPPAAAGAQVDARFSLYPVDVAVPVDGFLASSVTGNIDLPDHWESALLDYVLFRAYSKDAEFGGNTQMAASYLGMFNAAVGSQLQSTALVAPKT